MKYFYDTEFIEDGHTIDLISIGIVAEDGRSYYAISKAFNPKKASAWVQANVLAHLPPRSVNFSDVSVSPRLKEESRAWRNRTDIREDLRRFIGDDPAPEFWAYYADYDHVALCQLFGTMMQLPKSATEVNNPQAVRPGAGATCDSQEANPTSEGEAY